MHNASRDATLNGKSLTGMLTEWQLSSKYPSSSSTQPEGVLEQQRCLCGKTRLVGIYVVAAATKQLSTQHVCILN